MKLLSLALFASLASFALALECIITENCNYQVVDNGVVLLQGARIEFVSQARWDRWKCAGDQTISVQGFDKTFGSAYEGWQVPMLEQGEPKVILTVRNFRAEKTITFEYKYLGSTKPGLNTANELVSTFPAFTHSPLTGRLAWQGSFVQPQHVGTGCTTGTQGGPCLLFNESDATHGKAIMLSALNEFLTTSRATRLWDKTPAVWAGSTVASVRDIPAEFAHKFILVGGDDGVTDTIARWGKMLTTYYRTARVPDITISTLGYQTDNGAQYCFGCKGDCPRLLLSELEYLKAAQVPVRYLSYQNAWWHTSGTAPWCVSDWDWVPQKVPMGVPEFSRRAGIPFQLYAPYFCNETKYAQNFTFLTSNPTLPTCEGFLFKEIVPEQSEGFYKWFFTLGKSYGMVSYETDFVNQNLNCVDRFLTEIGAAEYFLDGMNQAATELNLSMQWCYASPSALLQALKYPTVTNFRGSFDYFYGGSWDIGLSSLLMWALRIAPSTDTFWTSDNGEVATTLGGCDRNKGCPEDHSDIGCELHTMLAIFSTGPVGFSDAINQTNAERINRTCRKDGVLLRPSKPATTMDRFLRSKFVLQSFSSRGSVGVLAYYVLGHHLNQEKNGVTVKLDELWPRVEQPGGWVWRLFSASSIAACSRNHSLATDCVSAVASSGSLVLPKTNSTFEPVLVTVTPVCESGWSLLGQVDKYVSLSSDRFASVQCTHSGMQLQVKGAPGEQVLVSFLNGVRILTKMVHLPDTPTQDIESIDFEQLDRLEQAHPESSSITVQVHVGN